jgi:peptidyl-prolyl cis-trans isomerase SurA
MRSRRSSRRRAATRRSALRAAVVAGALLAAAPSVRAETLDRVVAVVGDRAIFQSNVEDEVRLLRFQETGAAATPDSALYTRALERLIDDQLVLAKADLQSIEVSETEIDESLEGTITNMKRQFGSEAAFQAQLVKEGLTEASLREKYRDDIRNQIRGNRLIEKEIRTKVAVTEDDMRAFYDLHVEEIPVLPRRVEIAQIIVRVQPDDAARAAALARIEEARTRIAAGEPFEEVAKALSEGPSANRGGDLGAFRPGAMEPAFDEAIRGLEPGKVSAPVETRVGVHLIRLDEKRDDGTVRAHHILALFPSSSAARDSARKRIEEAVAAVAGGADFGEVAKTASDDEESRDKGGVVGLFSVEDLPEEYRTIVQGLDPGEISPIHESDEGFLVFRLNRFEEPRKATLDEVKREIREAVRQEKMAEEFAAYVQKLRKEIYVRVL